MFLDDNRADQSNLLERESEPQPVMIKDNKTVDETGKTAAAGALNSRVPGRSYVAVEDAATSETAAAITPSTTARAVPGRKRPTRTRWWVLAAGSAVLMTILTCSAIYLLTKKPSTVDQLIILTVPSGAEIKLNSQTYGQSPVKLEQLPLGNYMLSIEKEGYEAVVKQIDVSDSTSPLEFKLELLPPPEDSDLPPEELIKRYEQSAEDAFGRGNYGLNFEGSALYYAKLISDQDSNNLFAQEMQERVHKAAHQAAKDALANKDMARAQEIYNFLLTNYPKDQDARAALAKLEGALALRKGEVRDLVRRAEDALRAGLLIEPRRTSAYSFAREALAIERQNAQARAVLNEVRDRLTSRIEDAYKRGDVDGAIKLLDQATQHFPDDKPLHTRQRELISTRATEIARNNDPSNRRLQGLAKYEREDFAAAIPDLEFALSQGKGSPDVISALARSYMKTGDLDKARHYFNQVPESRDDQYRSAIAALGDIAKEQGDTAKALGYYKQARQLGGSTLYSIAKLDDKIEQIEKKQREKAAEPIPVTISAKHEHTGMFGKSCKGILVVNSSGIRYDSSDNSAHHFSWNLLGVSVRVVKDELSLTIPSKTEKFKVGLAEAERFREAINRYQQAFAPANK